MSEKNYSPGWRCSNCRRVNDLLANDCWHCGRDRKAKDNPMNLEELKKFCARDGTRYHIDKPWSDRDWTYATNGHIIVRIPRLVSVPEDKLAPDAAALFERSTPREKLKWI